MRQEVQNAAGIVQKYIEDPVKRRIIAGTDRHQTIASYVVAEQARDDINTLPPHQRLDLAATLFRSPVIFRNEPDKITAARYLVPVIKLDDIDPLQVREVYNATRNAREYLRTANYTGGKIIAIDSEKRDVEPLELYLRAIRQRFGLSQQALAEITSLDISTYTFIERGRIISPHADSAEKIITGIKRVTGEDDEQAEAVAYYLTEISRVSQGREANQRKMQLRDEVPFHGWVVFERDGHIVDLRTRDEKWYDLLDTSSLGMGVRSLRVAAHFNRHEFAAEARISKRGLEDLEDGRCGARLSFINEIIWASELDPEGKAAQRLRLKAVGKQPMTLEQLQQASFGELIGYLQVIKGIDTTTIAKKTHISKSTFNAIKAGRQPHEDFKNRFIAWLQPHTALEAVVNAKYYRQNEALSDVLLQAAASENILFVDTDQAETASVIYQKYQSQELSDVYRCSTLGQVLYKLREKHNIAQGALAQRIDVRHTAQQRISERELSIRVPEDSIIFAQIEALGYDIHHPVTQFALSLGVSERKRG